MRFPTLTSIEQLVELHIAETTTIEFKSQLPLASRTDRRELLKDLTGMGNGGGGTLIFGIDEDPTTSAASNLTPLPDASIIGQIEAIVQSGIRPPLVWSHATHQADNGWIVVVDVEQSPLGPYMVDAYDEKRFYKRTGKSVNPMSEQEVRDAYALAFRTRERRDEVWAQHRLPMAVAGDQPWLVVSAVPEEPLSEIIDSRQIDLLRLVAPPSLSHYLSHTRLQLALSSIRHWADGLAADDGVNGNDARLVLRLHRDGAAGIAEYIQPELQSEWIVRKLNAFLLYLGWFWKEFSLQRPVEVELSIVGLRSASLPADFLSPTSRSVVEPPGVTINTMSVQEVLLPWELNRATVRHALLRRFGNRLEQAFGRSGATTLFDRGWLYGKDGLSTGFALSNGLIADHRRGNLRAALVDAAGQAIDGSGSVRLYVADGVLLDTAGEAVATLEMAPGVGCPDGFLPNVREIGVSPPQQGVEPIEVPGTVVLPHPTGTWGQQELRDFFD
jgi:hypothetical protein